MWKWYLEGTEIPFGYRNNLGDITILEEKTLRESANRMSVTGASFYKVPITLMLSEKTP